MTPSSPAGELGGEGEPSAAPEPEAAARGGETKEEAEGVPLLSP